MKINLIDPIRLVLASSNTKSNIQLIWVYRDTGETENQPQKTNMQKQIVIEIIDHQASV